MNLKNLSIELSTKKCQHLLLTGRNGSGKTSLLNALKKTLSAININRWKSYKQYEKSSTPTSRNRYYENFSNGIRIEFNSDDTLDNAFMSGEFITSFFPAHRQTSITLANGVENVELASAYGFDTDPAQLLIKYMVHLKTQQAYARQENDVSVEQSIQKWFDRFQKALGELLDDENLTLEYNYKQYNFLIHQMGILPSFLSLCEIGFNELSDGYSSLIRIVADLILRMEKNWLLKGNMSHYDTEGIALIDELETHLHIELQRKILPFLTTFFPRIQFIVSTHSPYILTSIPNAVIYDLEKQVMFTDMTNFSIDDVAEAFH